MIVARGSGAHAGMVCSLWMKGDPWWLGFPFESKHRGGFREDPSWFFWVVAALTRALLQDDFPGQALGVGWNLPAPVDRLR